MTVFVWAFGALSWSVFANLVMGDTAYVTRNVVLTLALLVLARRLGLRPGAMGLRSATARRGLITGLGSVVLVAVVLLVALALADRVPLVSGLLGDQRADLTTGALTYAVLVRIPIGTVLFEEVLFRGLGLALLSEEFRPVPAVLLTSAVFGLWHIAPTIVALRLNDIDPTSTAGMGALVGSVLVTFLAGVVFAWLRLRTGSLLAPCLAHWATNALGLLAAAAT
jgi:uncharacterized protein